MIKDKRFIYNSTSQYITDELTGELYHGSNKTCKVLNQLNNECDEKAELLYEFTILLEKYNINSIEKLDKVLFNQRLW